MAVEDALVLAEVLDAASDLDDAIDAFVGRRAQHVRWVREQSAAIGELLGRPAGVRDQGLRDHGRQAFTDRFVPLTAPP